MRLPKALERVASFTSSVFSVANVVIADDVPRVHATACARLGFRLVAQLDSIQYEPIQSVHFKIRIRGNFRGCKPKCQRKSIYM